MGTSSDMLAATGLLNSSLMNGMGSLGGYPYGAGGFPSGPCTLFVYNLHAEATETELWQQFGPYGGVQNVKVHVMSSPPVR